MKYFLFILGILITSLGLSQPSYSVATSSVPSNYLGVLTCTTVQNQPYVSGNNGLMNLTGGQPDYYPHYTSEIAPYITNWTQITGPTPNSWYANMVQQPNLYLVLGGLTEGSSVIDVQAVSGPNTLGGLYCGFSSSTGGKFKYVDIYNEDTLYIDHVLVPKAATLRHHGPAPLVIKKQFINYGTVYSDADNILCQATKEQGRIATFDNRGTFVGRMKYQTPVDYKRTQIGIVDLFNWYSPLTLEDSIRITTPYLSIESANYLQNLIDNQELSEVAHYIDSLYQANYTYDPLSVNGQQLYGYPLKGTRFAAKAGDFNVKHMWIDHRGQIREPFLVTEDNYEGLTIDQVVGNGELAVMIYAPGYQNAGYNLPTNNDTLVYIGDQLTAIFETYEWVNDSITYVLDTIPVADLEFLINIAALEDPIQGPAYSWATLEETDVDNFTNFNLVLFDAFSNTMTLWSDWRVESPNKNRLYEKEGHYMIMDTTYSSNDVFQNFGLSGVPDVGTVGETPSASYLLEAGFPESYPAIDYDEPFMSSFNEDNYPYFNGRFVEGIDATTPVSFPSGYWWFKMGSQITESILEYRGTPWMNSDEAYTLYPNHPIIPGQELIPNLKPPAWSGEIGNFEARIYLPPKTDVQYVYAPNGNLFESSSWANCYDASAENFNYDSLQIITFCETELAAYNTISPDNFYINGNNDNLVDEDYLSYLLSNTSVSALRENNFYFITSPVLGYLDLDRVAERFFDDNTEAQYLDFHWYNTDTNPIVDPSQYLLQLDPLLGEKKFWRKKYYRLGDEVMTSELDFWLSLLFLEFEANNGAGFSDLALNIVNSLADGEVTFSDSPIINWLYNGQFNPAQYVELSQYVPPGIGFWVGNNLGAESVLKIRPEDGIYDYNWPDSTNQIFVGSLGPEQTLGRQGASNLPEYPNADILENHNVLLAYAWQNDSTYFPFPAIMHKFDDDAEIGTTGPEDQGVQFPIVPYAYTDSSNFVASRYFKEDVPHNASPTHLHIVSPPINGAWVFSPIRFQSPDNVASNSQAISNLTKPLRLGIQLYDENGEYDIRYLDYMDTMYVRFEDYNFPIEAKTYWTTLQCDFTGDGEVSVADLTMLLGYLGLCEPSANFNSTFDTNEDGCINIGDLTYLFTELGHNIGVEEGEFEGITSLVATNGRLTGTLKTEFESFIENQLPSYLEAGFTYDPSTLTIKYFGEKITVYDSELNVIVSGYNQVQLPDVDKFYLVAAESAVCKINTNATLIVSATNPGDYTYNSIVYTPAQGSSILQFWDASLSSASVAEWTDLYTDFDQFSGNLNPLPLVSPYINQLYYGWSSNKNKGPLYSPSNAITPGLVDVFSAGQPGRDIYSFDKGVYADSKWKSASTGYENEISIGSDNIFIPKNILFGFVSKRDKENLHSDKIHNSSETLKISHINGASSTFGPYSAITTELDPSASVWGTADIKEYYDAPFENAVISMVDMMTLRDYFRFKLKGNSPKFGATNAVNSGNWAEQSFGTAYNINTVIGEQQQAPAKQWAPSACNTYQDWTDNIIAPFFAAHMGQPVSITIESAVPTFTGEERNNSANHYQWFENSTLFRALGTYGPLVYDFDWNGVWEQKDLDIWNSITSVWNQLGDDAGSSYYAPSNYYRAGTDALNTIVNALPEYSSKKNAYTPAKNFDQYFTIVDGEAFIDTRIANWANCLNGNRYVEGNQTVGTAVQASQFTYTTDLPLLEPATLSLAMSSEAPRNTVNAVEITDYHNIPPGYLTVPSSTFFPVSLIRN